MMEAELEADFDDEGTSDVECDGFGRPLSLLAWRPLDAGTLSDAKRNACHELFRGGDISWLLNPTQLELLNWLDEGHRELSVIATSRQIGKSFFCLAYCIAYCLKNPRASVMFVAPFGRYMMQKINMSLTIPRR
jgi:hypothetical protein